jgi:dTDP-4-dehydrorhamnose 3,5-epimerase
MHFASTPIAGVIEVRIDWHQDVRGAFGRSFCSRVFGEHGLCRDLAQCSLSTNGRAGTVRGFHFQVAPHREAKLVQCVELSADNGVMLYIPEGCAHGFQTLGADTTVFYYISTAYEPTASRGVRWDDPAIGVRWPLADAVLSERDRMLPLLADCGPE